MQRRYVVDRGVKYLLFVSALVSLFVVFLIGFFTLREAWPAFQEMVATGGRYRLGNLRSSSTEVVLSQGELDRAILKEIDFWMF